MHTFKRSVFRLAALASLGVYTSCGHAVDGANSDSAELALLYGGEENISIATGSAQPLRLAPAVATVITAQDIETVGATTLDEALALVPGLYVGVSPFNRLNPNWSIRGIATDQTPQTLLLRNNVPITHFFHGARPNLFRLPVADIERIEVIRGPGSAIYGADAFAGVINIITKAAAGDSGLQVGGRLGSFEQRDAWLQHTGSWAGWDTRLNLEFTHTEGDPSRVVSSDLQTVFDSLFLTNASLAPGSLATGYEVLNASLRLEQGPWDISLWHWRSMDAGLGAGGAQTLDSVGNQDIDLTQLDVNYQLNKGIWNSQLRFSYRELNDYPTFVLFPPGTVLPVGTDGNIGTTPFGGIVSFPEGVIGLPNVHDHFSELEWVSHYTGWIDHHLRFGVGIKHEHEEIEERKNFGSGVIDGTEGIVDGTLTDVTGTAFVAQPNQQRTVRYLSAQDTWHFAPDWELTAGLRYDSYSDFGDTLNPRLALVWSTRHDLVSKFLYGRAFRAPSFGEQYARNNPIVLGNPNLEPERIESYEIAFDYRPNPDLTTRLNFFHYQIEDLIYYVPDAQGQTSTAQNAQNRNGHGLELEVEWQALADFRLDASYAWQHSEDSDTGQEVPNTPGQMATLRATWRLAPDWSLASQSYWVADFVREQGDPRPPLADYTLTNLTLRHKFDGLELSASIRNLFDEDAKAPTLFNPGLGNAAIPDDYPLPERSFWVELRYGY